MRFAGIWAYANRKEVQKMSRFTKAMLLIAGLILAVVAEAALVSGAYIDRGYFSIGGEWFLPAVAAAVWVLVKEMKRLYREITQREETL